MKKDINREKFFCDDKADIKFKGFIHDAYEFIEKKQMLRTDLWERFVRQFETNADDIDEGWKGEFWGKMMRGASLVYSYTKDERLYEILKNSVESLLSCADEYGRISTYSREIEFRNWDIWCRKYVMLGMEYFLEVCKEENLKEKIIKSICAQVDYLIEKLGNEEGKISITATSTFWRGLNSSSVLEAVVRLYAITGEIKYRNFAEYIIKEGGSQVSNIFRLAFEDGLYPYQYPTTKAYEMTSCFEGLLEYYKVTGNEDCKKAVINFADKILESDFTVIGCCGCTEELFDHSSVRQANTNNGYIFQETCVTVTLMKFLSRVHLLTGNPKYIDAFEKSLYNAYLGSFNTEDKIEPEMIRDFPTWIAEPMPFDSYSPLTADVRGKRVGGKQLMADNYYYGCCACIGGAGIGMVHKMQYLKACDGIVINLFIDGSAKISSPFGKEITFKTETAYPADGKVKITFGLDNSEQFKIYLRNPAWNKNGSILINGNTVSLSEGYTVIDKLWENGDTIEFSLDMRTKAIYPEAYGSQVLMNNVVWEHNYVVPNFDTEDPIAHKHIALRRGPLMLAQENRLGYSVDNPVSIKVDENGYVDIKESEKEIPYKCILKVEAPLENGETITLTDYASAGKLYSEESKMAVWMLTE